MFTDFGEYIVVAFAVVATDVAVAVAAAVTVNGGCDLYFPT